MSDKNFKVKNGLTIEGTINTLISPDNAGGISITGTIAATSFTGSGAGLTSVPNTALANKSITVNGTAVDLGGTVTIATGSTINPMFMIGGM
jgi:hypothetical protein